MEANTIKPVSEVITAIGKTQDGGAPKENTDRFSTFILACIHMAEYGCEVDGFCLLDNLESDFGYMIDQLKKAKTAIEKLQNK